MRSYRCTHFNLQELVPPEVFAIGECAWELLDPRLLISLDTIREVLNVPIFVNSWQVGGPLKNRGFRAKDCTEGKPLSQHRFGRGVDFHSTAMTALELRLRVIEINRILPHLTCIEDNTPTWVHVDCRAASWDGMRIIKP